MGNRAVLTPLLMIACVLASAILVSAPKAASASSGRDMLAFSIIDKLNKRLCERQERLGGLVRLVSPSKCEETPPPPPEPTVTLTASPATITSGQSTTLTWSSSNATSCTAFLGWTGSKALNGSQSVSPTQTTTYQLDCTGPGGVGSDDATVTVTVVTPTQPTVDITASPMTITAGATSTLTWNSDNADSCTASNGWSGSKAVDGTQAVTPSSTTTYTITCTGAGGSANDSVTVTVNPAAAEPTLEFSASPTTITTVGTSTLSWASTNATSCTASGGWSGAKSLSGTQIVSPNATTTYSLNCTGDGGSISKSVTVNVTAVPQPTVDLVAAPTSVTPGAGSATTTLTWTTTNTTTCTASGGGWTGSKAVNGTEIITPTTTTTYFLNCSGTGGSASDNVTVVFVPAANQPTLTFTANPMTVNEGSTSSATTTLTWDSTDATSCTASGATEWTGSKALDGTLVVTPTADVTYELDCTGDGGTVHKEVVIDFVPAQQPTGNLLITEVLYDLASSTPAQGNEAVNEWIELYNGTNQTLNLGGYFIQDNSETFIFPQGTSLEPGSFLLITAASSTSPTSNFWSIPSNATWLTFAGFGGGSGQLANGGDRVLLFNSASSTVDGVSWGTDFGAFSAPGLVVPTNVGASIRRTSLTTDTGTAADWEIATTPVPGQ